MNEIKWKDHAGSKPLYKRIPDENRLMMKQNPDVGLQKLVLKISCEQHCTNNKDMVEACCLLFE
jgi:hypothetical protein